MIKNATIFQETENKNNNYNIPYSRSAGLELFNHCSKCEYEAKETLLQL